MAPKWFKVLAAVVGALAAVYALTWIPRSERPRSFFVPGDPVKLRMESASSKVTLEKKGGVWRVTDPVDWRADEEAVLRVISGLKGLILESEVTRRPESYAQYDLADGKEVRLTVWGKGGKAPVEIFLGKDAGFTDRAYVRVGKDPAVYFAAGMSREAADLPAVRWRDRSLIGRTDIVRVRRTEGKRSFLLERSSSSWTVDGKPTDPARAASFVSSLQALTADDLVDPPVDLKTYGLDKSSASFELSFSSGTPVTLFFGKGDPRPIRKEGVETLFLVPANRLDALEKDVPPAEK